MMQQPHAVGFGVGTRTVISWLNSMDRNPNSEIKACTPAYFIAERLFARSPCDGLDRRMTSGRHDDDERIRVPGPIFTTGLSRLEALHRPTGEKLAGVWSIA